MNNPPGIKPLPKLTVPRVVNLSLGPGSYQLVSSGSPYWYDAQNLPTGLGINHQTGLISGTATSTGTWVVIVSATDYVGECRDTLVFEVA